MHSPTLNYLYDQGAIHPFYNPYWPGLTFLFQPTSCEDDPDHLPHA